MVELIMVLDLYLPKEITLEMVVMEKIQVLLDLLQQQEEMVALV
jgi:hypothetical protein